jgi:hypothetical protein
VARCANTREDMTCWSDAHIEGIRELLTVADLATSLQISESATYHRRLAGEEPPAIVISGRVRPVLPTSIGRSARPTRKTGDDDLVLTPEGTAKASTYEPLARKRWGPHTSAT